MRFALFLGLKPRWLGVVGLQKFLNILHIFSKYFDGRF
jgi:hypothetical protein